MVSNFFDIEKYVLHFENLHRYFRVGLKLRKNTWCIRIESIGIVKKYIEFNTQERIEAKADNNSLMSVVKTGDVYEAFNKDNGLILAILLLSKNIMNLTNSNKLVVAKMKDETGVLLLRNLLHGSQRCIHSW